MELMGGDSALVFEDGYAGDFASGAGGEVGRGGGPRPAVYFCWMGEQAAG